MVSHSDIRVLTAPSVRSKAARLVAFKSCLNLGILPPDIVLLDSHSCSMLQACTISTFLLEIRFVPPDIPFFGQVPSLWDYT